MKKKLRNRAGNWVDPSTTTSKSWGYVIPGKGGSTTNAKIFEKRKDAKK